MVGVPVLLLTFDGAVRGVPAAVVHGLLLAVITLQAQETAKGQQKQVNKTSAASIRAYSDRLATARQDSTVLPLQFSTS